MSGEFMNTKPKGSAGARQAWMGIWSLVPFRFSHVKPCVYVCVAVTQFVSLFITLELSLKPLKMRSLAVTC